MGIRTSRRHSKGIRIIIPRPFGQPKERWCKRDRSAVKRDGKVEEEWNKNLVHLLPCSDGQEDATDDEKGLLHSL